MVHENMTGAHELTIEGFDHQPMQITATWSSRRVVTRQPTYGEYEQWQAELNLVCPSSAFLLALVLRTSDSKGSYGRIHRSSADYQAAVKLSFRPFSWHDPVRVQLALLQAQGKSTSDGVRLGVRDRDLRAHPRGIVNLLADSTDEHHTGAILRLAEIGADITAEAFVITKSDTQAARGRWRVRREQVAFLPPIYSFLGSGRQHGDL
jgi:hypothetical protein